MDISFVVFGVTIALGSALIYAQFKRTRLSMLAFLLMTMCGVGTIFVGSFLKIYGEAPITPARFLGCLSAM